MNLLGKTLVSMALEQEEKEEEDITFEKVLEVMKKAAKEKEKKYEKLRKDYIKELNTRLLSLAAKTDDDFPDNYISTGHIPLTPDAVLYTRTPWLNKECLNQIADYYKARGFKVEWRLSKEEEWLRIFLPELTEEEK